MRLFFYAPLVVVLLGALLSIAPFDHKEVLFQSRPIDLVPAKQLISGTMVRQAGLVPSLGDKNNKICFGIQFATYARKNEGRLIVTWKQGASVQSWVILSRELADNHFHYFCPDKSIASNAHYAISILSKGSPVNHAPTVWLTSSTLLGVAKINDIEVSRSLSLAFSSYKEVTFENILRVDRGSYLGGWLISLLVFMICMYISGHSAMRKPD